MPGAGAGKKVLPRNRGGEEIKRPVERNAEVGEDPCGTNKSEKKGTVKKRIRADPREWHQEDSLGKKTGLVVRDACPWGKNGGKKKNKLAYAKNEPKRRVKRDFRSKNGGKGNSVTGVQTHKEKRRGPTLAILPSIVSTNKLKGTFFWGRNRKKKKGATKKKPAAKPD